MKTLFDDREPTNSGATVSACGRYRYSLWRRWGPGNAVCFVMLNPSTADASLDDPTIRRCRAFARAWRYDALEVRNLFAWRATDPKELARADDPVGPEGDAALTSIAAETVFVAWGAVRFPARVRRVVDLLGERTLWCLGTTKDGQPRHPLYVPGSCRPLPWVPAFAG